MINKKRRSRILAFTIGMFLLLNIVQIVYLQTRIKEYNADNGMEHTTAFATGITSFCINRPPDFNLTCNLTIPWGYPYYCKGIDATDNDPTVRFYYDTGWVTPTKLFNVTYDGEINFTPPKSSIGNHTVRVYVYDDSGCSNGVVWKDYNISIILANHAPYLAIPIPDQTITRQTSFTFYLNDYFVDIDGDILQYFAGVSNSGSVSITIDNSSQVTVKGLECGDSSVFFVATDPGNLSNTSNTIKYTVTGCTQNPPSNTGAGGGGNGGGGYTQHCEPLWKCGKWSPCYVYNITELECRDYNGCDPHNYIKIFQKNCTYVPEVYNCKEEWNCTTWGPCINGNQSRICLDLTSCGTNNTKPPELQYCTGLSSCFDGVKDGNETGIDCGGECKPCPATEKPATIAGALNTTILLALIFTLLTIGAVGFTFRKQIGKFIAGLKKDKHKKKATYLKEHQKEKLLQNIYVIQTKFEEDKFNLVVSNISILLREYFKELLDIERLTKDEVENNLPKLKNKELEKIIYEFYLKFISFESHNKTLQKPDRFEMQALIDEILNTVYIVSEFTEKDAILCVKERTGETEITLEKCYLMLSNLYIALEFSEIKEAKKIYKNLLAKYESMPIIEKQKIYSDIIRSYNALNYIDDIESED